MNATLKFAVSTAVLAALPFAAKALDGPVTLNAALAGAAEVPGPGDPDGTGTAKVEIGPGGVSLCYTLSANAIAPATLAHIHRGSAGVAGPPVVTLDPPGEGESSGCAEVTVEIAAEIARSPADYYVNIHNAEFPAGAIRGQLAN